MPITSDLSPTAFAELVADLSNKKEEISKALNLDEKQ